MLSLNQSFLLPLSCTPAGPSLILFADLQYIFLLGSNPEVLHQVPEANEEATRPETSYRPEANQDATRPETSYRPEANQDASRPKTSNRPEANQASRTEQGSKQADPTTWLPTTWLLNLTPC